MWLSELYEAHEGEGPDVGTFTTFVRFGFCDGLPTGHCAWCDSMHSVDPARRSEWEMVDTTQLLRRLEVMTAPRVSLTGGNPALYELDELVSGIRLWGRSVNVETQGSIWRDWMEACHVTVSPKPPSAGRCDWEKLEKFMKQAVVRADEGLTVKVVVGDEEDFAFAERVFDEWGEKADDFFLSTLSREGASIDDVLASTRRLQAWAEVALPRARVMPQVHYLLYGSERKR